MRDGYNRKPSPRTAPCRRARKLRQARLLCQCTRWHALTLSVPANSLSCTVHSLPASLPICRSKSDISLEQLFRLERWWPGKRSWWDSARTERLSSQTELLHMLWNSFQRRLGDIGEQSCYSRLCLSRPGLWYSAGNSRYGEDTFRARLRTCSPYAGERRWWRGSYPVRYATLQAECTCLAECWE